MLDGLMRKLIDPPLARLGAGLAKTGLSANAVTVLGLAIGLAASLAIVLGALKLAIFLILLNRLADGLDGALARATRPSDAGGFLDITLDFFFYSAVPLAFALADPAANALPAAVLLASFYMNGASFLSFAIMAERHKLTTTARGLKSLYFMGGFAEGTETIVVFLLFCLLPQWFGALAYGFAGLCFISAISRVATGWLTLRDE